jgi:hypothetical protein
LGELGFLKTFLAFLSAWTPGTKLSSKIVNRMALNGSLRLHEKYNGKVKEKKQQFQKTALTTRG